ncbi:hypothetical protein ACROYT_G031485 [Oculina patagonica]
MPSRQIAWTVILVFAAIVPETTSLENKKRDKCKVLCYNGGTCNKDNCTCKNGFTGKFCQSPICQEQCVNGGRCVLPDKCLCPYGFVGYRCQQGTFL